MNCSFHTHLGWENRALSLQMFPYSGDLDHIIQKLSYHFSFKFIPESSSMSSHVLLFLWSSYWWTPLTLSIAEPPTFTSSVLSSEVFPPILKNEGAGYSKGGLIDVFIHLRYTLEWVGMRKERRLRAMALRCHFSLLPLHVFLIYLSYSSNCKHLCKCLPAPFLPFSFFLFPHSFLSFPLLSFPSFLFFH